jgi:hypothetical protein
VQMKKPSARGARWRFLVMKRFLLAAGSFWHGNANSRDGDDDGAMGARLKHG